MLKKVSNDAVLQEKPIENRGTFYRNIILLLLINLIVKPIYILGIDAQVQNSLGNNIYGLFFTLFSFCMLFQIVLDPGILNYNNQLISKNTNDVSQLFSKIAGTKIILIGVFIASLVFIGLFFDYTQEHLFLLLGVALILILNSFLAYLRSHFSALGKYKYEALFSGLDKLLMIFLIGYFLYVRNEMSLKIFVGGQIVALLVSCLIFLIMLGRMFKIRLKFSLKDSMSLIKKTTPYALVLLLMTLYTRIDSLMLQQMIDDQEYSVGVYASGFRLLDAANMIGILFALLMLPMFSKLIDQRKQLLSLVDDITQLLFVICTLLSLLCWYYSEPIIDLIYENTTQMHYRVFKYLMVGFWAMCMSNIYGCLFLAKGHLKSLNALFVLGIILNFGLNYYFIPDELAFGAVKATLLTQFFVFIGQYLLAYRNFNFELTLLKTGSFVGVFAGIWLIIYLFNQYIHLYWPIEAILISFLAVVLSFLCGFLRFPFEKSIKG